MQIRTLDVWSHVQHTIHIVCAQSIHSFHIPGTFPIILSGHRSHTNVHHRHSKFNNGAICCNTCLCALRNLYYTYLPDLACDSVCVCMCSHWESASLLALEDEVVEQHSNRRHVCTVQWSYRQAHCFIEHAQAEHIRTHWNLISKTRDNTRLLIMK